MWSPNEPSTATPPSIRVRSRRCSRSTSSPSQPCWRTSTQRVGETELVELFGTVVVVVVEVDVDVEVEVVVEVDEDVDVEDVDGDGDVVTAMVVDVVASSSSAHDATSRTNTTSTGRYHPAWLRGDLRCPPPIVTSQTQVSMSPVQPRGRLCDSSGCPPYCVTPSTPPDFVWADLEQ